MRMIYWHWMIRCLHALHIKFTYWHFYIFIKTFSWWIMIIERNDFNLSTVCLLQKTIKMSRMNSMNYWKQLEQLNMKSLERHREKYLIIYTWRILEGQVPTPNTNLTSLNSTRNGRFCRAPKVKSSAPANVKTLRHNSLAFKEPSVSL